MQSELHTHTRTHTLRPHNYTKGKQHSYAQGSWISNTEEGTEHWYTKRANAPRQSDTQESYT